MNKSLILTENTYQRIARLLSQGVAKQAVAEASDLTMDELNWILESDIEYKRISASQLNKKAEQLEQINESWDSIEQKALQVVSAELDSEMVDPEYAKQMAILANKAQRRKCVDVTAPTQLTAQVNINANFLSVIKNFAKEAVEAIEKPSKVRNQLDRDELQLIEGY